MIKIGYLIDTIESDTAGTQKQLLEVIGRLDRSIFEPCLICLRESIWMKNNDDLPCDAYILGYKGILKPNLTIVINRLSALMDRIRIEILQTFFEDSIFVGWLGVLFSRCKPALLSSRRDIGLGNARPWYHRFYRAALPIVNLGFDGIVANSEAVRKYVASHEVVPPAKIKVIHNGVSLPDRDGAMPGGRGDNDAPVIGLVANLYPVKRVDLFLRALFLLRQGLPDLRFRAVVCGDGPERQSLLNLADRLGLGSIVEFAGKVKDVDSYLSRLDIGVLCSDREGLSNAVLEYMAHALPVVATAVGGNPELVDRRNGFCVEPGRPEALADALIRLCADRGLRLKLGMASFDRLKSSYSWEKSMRELEGYYVETAGRRSGGRTETNFGMIA